MLPSWILSWTRKKSVFPFKTVIFEDMKYRAQVVWTIVVVHLWNFSFYKKVCPEHSSKNHLACVLNGKRKVIQDWNDMRVSTWWQDFHLQAQNEGEGLLVLERVSERKSRVVWGLDLRVININIDFLFPRVTPVTAPFTRTHKYTTIFHLHGQCQTPAFQNNTKHGVERLIRCSVCLPC